VLRVVRSILLVCALTTRARAHDNSDRPLGLALSLVVSRAPESSISSFSALGLDSANTRLLLGLLRPPFMVAEDLAFASSAAPSVVILVVRVLVLLDDAAQRRASRSSRSANLLGSRVEELLRGGCTSDSAPHLSIPRSVVLLLLLLFGLRVCASTSVIASSLTAHRRRHTLSSSRLARNRSLMRRQIHILLRFRRRSRSSIRLCALRRVRAALAGRRTGRSVMVRTVVLFTVATFGPDPCCQAADGDGRDCDQGHPVAEGALLTGRRGRCVERASRALSSVVGHVHRGLIGHVM